MNWRTVQLSFRAPADIPVKSADDGVRIIVVAAARFQVSFSSAFPLSPRLQGRDGLENSRNRTCHILSHHTESWKIMQCNR